MQIISALNGDILHFNNNAIPAFNDICAKLDKVSRKYMAKDELLKMLTTADVCVDFLFNPRNGIIKHKVKSFDKEAFYAIYEMCILYLISRTNDSGFPEIADEYRNQFIEVLDRKEECINLSKMIDGSSDTSERISLIWNNIASHTSGLSVDNEKAFASTLRGLVIIYSGL